MLKNLFFILTATFFAIAPSHSYASEAGKDMPGAPVNMLSARAFYVSLSQNPQSSEGEFTMRLSKRGAVSGCAHAQEQKPDPKKIRPWKELRDGENNVGIKYIGKHARFMLLMPEITNADEEPRYTNYDCDTNYMDAYVDVPLDRDTLLKKGIKEFNFKTPDLDFGSYEIEVNKEALTFKGTNKRATQTAWLTLWFFPKDTIKLHVPGAKTGGNVLQKLHAFAANHDLTPMEEILKGYHLPPHAQDYAYFVDKNHTFTKELDVQNNTIEIGNISISKTYYGPNGPEEKMTELPIHASLVFENSVTQ